MPIYWLEIVKGGLLIAKAQKLGCHRETTTTVGYMVGINTSYMAGINHQGQGLDFDDHRTYFDEYRLLGEMGPQLSRKGKRIFAGKLADLLN